VRGILQLSSPILRDSEYTDLKPGVDELEEDFIMLKIPSIEDRYTTLHHARLVMHTQPVRTSLMVRARIARL